MSAEPALSVKDAHGRQISLLNDASCPVVTPQEQQQQQQQTNQSNSNRRRYHCTEPGCKKSFTTSGHLARHNRIHTGEKNFNCLYPGCPSRFSRQDNMMQHYRTHMSSKSRRHPYHHHHQQYPPQHHQPLPSSLHHHTPSPPSLGIPPERKLLPQLHRHKHIRTDSKEHNLRSLHQACLTTSIQHRYQPYRIPTYQQQQPSVTSWPHHPLPHLLHKPRSSSTPTISFVCQSPPSMNYQHRHQINATRLNNDSHHPSTNTPPTTTKKPEDDSDLLQLANIVSTFG
ncbi:hypothetical protein BC941DRAFT_497432 [Chlamydoabsidia padenii]|nr:hypothetical protein BC941DRAFT_497432 [Chlamydoabsidia padenii]